MDTHQLARVRDVRNHCITWPVLLCSALIWGILTFGHRPCVPTFAPPAPLRGMRDWPCFMRHLRLVIAPFSRYWIRYWLWRRAPWMSSSVSSPNKNRFRSRKYVALSYCSSCHIDLEYHLHVVICTSFEYQFSILIASRPFFRAFSWCLSLRLLNRISFFEKGTQFLYSGSLFIQVVGSLEHQLFDLIAHRLFFRALSWFTFRVVGISSLDLIAHYFFLRVRFWLTFRGHWTIIVLFGIAHHLLFEPSLGAHFWDVGITSLRCELHIELSSDLFLIYVFGLIWVFVGFYCTQTPFFGPSFGLYCFGIVEISSLSFTFFLSDPLFIYDLRAPTSFQGICWSKFFRHWHVFSSFFVCTRFFLLEPR